MKKRLFLLFIVLTNINAFACSCWPTPNSFCGSNALQAGRLVFLATGARYGVDSIFGQYRKYPYIKVTPIEFLQGYDGRDSLKIYGQDGFNCNIAVNDFSEIDTVLFSLTERISTSYSPSFGGKSYDITYCGIYFLRYSEGLLYGYVTDDINGMMYDDFKTFIPSCKPVGIEEKRTINASIFPNPATNQIEISIPPDALQKYRNDALQFQLYEVTGRAVHTQIITSEKTLLSVAHLPQGIYYWRMASASHTLQQGKLAKH